MPLSRIALDEDDQLRGEEIMRRALERALAGKPRPPAKALTERRRPVSGAKLPALRQTDDAWVSRLYPAGPRRAPRRPVVPRPKPKTEAVDAEKLVKRLREACRARGQTLLDAAEAVGVSERTLGRKLRAPDTLMLREYNGLVAYLAQPAPIKQGNRRNSSC